MGAPGFVFAGAVRPPRCFEFHLRFLAALILTFALLTAVHAQTQEANCRYIGLGPIQMEGFDGADPFGFQFIVRDNRWVLGRSPFGVILLCPSCPQSDISKGVLALGRSPYLDVIREGELRGEIGQEAASWPEFALHPRAVALALWRLTSQLPLDVKAAGEAAPITLWGIPGRARAVSITLPNRVAPGVAIALEDRCLSLFAVLFRKDEGEVQVDDVLATNGSLGVLKYQPERHRLSPAIEFPLGDARRKWEQDELPSAAAPDNDPGSKPDGGKE